MNAYRFIFFVGFLNITIPFLGIPFVYKNYILLTIAGITIVYALILRAIEKEKSFAQSDSNSVAEEQKTIEQVVDMVEVTPIIMDVKPKKRGRKKIIVTQDIYE